MDTSDAAGFRAIPRRRLARAGPTSKSDGEGAMDVDQMEQRMLQQGIVLKRIEVEESADMPVDDVEEGENDGADEEKPSFPALSLEEQQKTARGVPAKLRMRRVTVPSHRYTPLKNVWMEIIDPLVKHMKLQVRMNTKRRCVEVRTSKDTSDISALQKAYDFLRAFMLGFDVADAIALLRLEDLFVESFEVKDVKTLQGDHLSRCIGRIAGKDGKTKHAIENATRTRIVVADQRVHVLGSFQSIQFARNAVCSLILGSPPGKVYNHLRTVSKRMQERL
eukprot:GDKH01018167.1.p1 GENE.GDKH01018167.1~~GDKH01018167.1.p1  ORF type:complete len:278 (+),score=57.22 GDKH01018167.1:94-927(+)